MTSQIQAYSSDERTTVIEASGKIDPQSTATLGQQLVSQMANITRDRIQDDALKNAHNNLTAIRQGNSIKKLLNIPLGEGDTAIVLAAGPSLKRNKVAEQLRQADFTGAIIATESSMLYCLRNGIVPHLVVTVDPHPKRIVRWFGDPQLTEADLKADDYFQRQDLDSSFADAMRVNDEILELLQRYGKHMRIAISSSASSTVVQRAHETGMETFWWNPMFDDPDDVNGVTKQLQRDNKLPSVNAGGNVGAAAWMMANAVLNKSHIAVTGMDFGYYAETPYRNTQYYYEALALVGEEHLDDVYMHVYNPHLQQWFYTDPAYMWYRNCFLSMAETAQCQTYNCTEGGILFGDAVQFMPLSQFLTRKP